MSATFERLCAVLARDHQLPQQRLRPEATLASLGIDALGTVELLWSIEDAFSIELPWEPVDLPTLGDVVRYVDAFVAGQGLHVPPAAPVAPGPHAP